jgi:hypothetical protein
MRKPLLRSTFAARRGAIVTLIFLCAIDVEVLPAQIIFDLRDHAPEAVLQTAETRSDLGRAFASGDLNADGYADLIIGAPGLDANGAYLDGAVYIFRGGRKLSGLIDFNTRLPDAEIVGNAFGSGAGASLLAADINGDGIDDLIIGAPAASFPNRLRAGAVEIFFGRKDFPGKIDLRSRPADVLIAGEAVDDKLGAVMATGDINGDAIADLLIAAPGATTENGVAAGVVYWIAGRLQWQSIFNFRGEEGGVTRLLGTAANNVTASALAAGNLNGDAFADVLIGAHKANFSGRVDCGETYLVLGKTQFPGTFDLKNADRLFVGAAVRHFSGQAVGSADFNHDRRDDIIIGAPGANNSSLNAAGSIQFFDFISPTADTIDLAQASGYFSIAGPRSDSRIAANLLFADFNNDGIADVLFGMPAAPSLSGVENAGALSVVYGKAGRTGHLNLQNQPPDYILAGSEAGSAIGSAFIAADFDGDAKTDLALKKNSGAVGNTVYLFYGSSLLTSVSAPPRHFETIEDFTLQAGYPNPFQRETRFVLAAAAPAAARVEVYDLTGCRVRALHAGPIHAGQTMLAWNGLNDNGQRLAAGIYFVRASAEVKGQRIVRTIKINLLF